MSATTMTPSLLQRTTSGQRFENAGRILFGLGLIGFGGQQLLLAHFVRLVPTLPSSLASPFFPRASGLLLLASGVAIVLRIIPRLGAFVFATLLFLSFLFLQVPIIFGDPTHGYQWTNPCKALALLGGAILLATTLPSTGAPSKPTFAGIERIGTFTCLVFFGAFLILAGVQHFVYADFVAQLVPAWMPGRAFWAYFAGVALLAGGLGTWIPQTRRLAGIFSGVMIFLWVIMLHLPRAFMETNLANEWDGVFEATAISGVAFLLAGRAALARKSTKRSSSPYSRSVARV